MAKALQHRRPMIMQQPVLHCRHTLRSSCSISRGECEPTLLPVWRHRECGIPHGEQQPPEPHSDVQGHSSAAGAPGSRPTQVCHPPLRPAGHQRKRLHAYLLAAYATCKPPTPNIFTMMPLRPCTQILSAHSSPLSHSPLVPFPSSPMHGW